MPNLLHCRTGTKDPFVPQSDDQFTVWNHAIKNGMSVYLTRHEINRGHDAFIDITVPALDLYQRPPFDYQLHQVAERLRREEANGV